MELKEKIYVLSLGCSKNLVDSEVMLGCLQKGGYRLTDIKETADIIIVNTCAFIEEATRESVETILRIAEQKKIGPCKHLIVCGCLPQRYQDELFNTLPEVDLFLGTGEFHNISKHIKNLNSGRQASKLLNKNNSFLMAAATPRIISTPGNSAYLKIAEGCSHGCTYCTIPGIRGAYRKRSPKSVLAEAKKLVESGIKELNFIAQDTTQYEGLAALLKKTAQIPGIKWIRLLYGHPQNLSMDIINVLAEEEKICSYIDLPLQHITDKILKKMGRRITRKKIESLLEKLKKRAPQTAIRTTFIVGFPGETDKDFEALLNFAADMKFDHLGAFQYREEEGTPAFRFDDKISKKTKARRYHELMKQQSKISKEKLNAWKGKTVEVLVESPAFNSKYKLQARTEFQAPEVDGVVYINEDVPRGSFLNVLITESLTYDLVGKVADKNTLL